MNMLASAKESIGARVPALRMRVERGLVRERMEAALGLTSQPPTTRAQSERWRLRVGRGTRRWPVRRLRRQSWPTASTMSSYALMAGAPRLRSAGERATHAPSRGSCSLAEPLRACRHSDGCRLLPRRRHLDEVEDDDELDFALPPSRQRQPESKCCSSLSVCGCVVS